MNEIICFLGLRAEKRDEIHKHYHHQGIYLFSRYRFVLTRKKLGVPRP